MENNFIVLFVGASGSGKTTLAENLERLFGWKSVISYTTRPKRSPNESGHIFVDDSKFDEILLRDGAVAYTEYSGYRYCATQRQAEESQIYVVDIPGVEYFRKAYTGNKKVLIVFLNLPEEVRKERMLMRGDTDTVEKRLRTDRMEFSQEQVEKLHPDLVLNEAYPLEKETAIVHDFVYMTVTDNADESSASECKATEKDKDRKTRKMYTWRARTSDGYRVESQDFHGRYSVECDAANEEDAKAYFAAIPEMPENFSVFPVEEWEEGIPNAYVERCISDVDELWKISSRIKKADAWDKCLDECERLCELAGLYEEWANADADEFQKIVEKAADILGVEIYNVDDF